VFSYITATGLITTLPTFQVVGGIEGLTSWAGIIFPDFPEPLFIPNRLDSFKITPKLDPVRHSRLKLLQVITGILYTFTAKVDASFCRTSGHSTFLAVRQPFF
jgi:hypothetical protein